MVAMTQAKTVSLLPRVDNGNELANEIQEKGPEGLLRRHLKRLLT